MKRMTITNTKCKWIAFGRCYVADDSTSCRCTGIGCGKYTQQVVYTRTYVTKNLRPAEFNRELSFYEYDNVYILKGKTILPVEHYLFRNIMTVMDGYFAVNKKCAILENFWLADASITFCPGCPGAKWCPDHQRYLKHRFDEVLEDITDEDIVF